MTDRLTIINDALIGTHNATVNAEFDHSDEWFAGDSAYRRAVGFLLSRHRWNFGKATGPLGAESPSALSAQYDYSLQIPNDALHINAVFNGKVPLTEYEIVGQHVCCNYNSSAGLQVEYTKLPAIENVPVLWAELLTKKVESYLLRSLNEDAPAAAQADRDAEMLLQEVRPLSDQQEPRRVFSISPSKLRRRTRGAR